MRERDPEDDQRRREGNDGVEREEIAVPLPLDEERLTEHQAALPPASRAARKVSTKLSSRSRSTTSRSDASPEANHDVMSSRQSLTTHSSSRPAPARRARMPNGVAAVCVGAPAMRSRLIPLLNACIGISATSRPPSI